MAAEERPDRGSIATIVATAAITLAIGVTAAALGGYLVPTNGDGPALSRATAEATAPQTDLAPPASPAVVLVPVTQDSRVAPPQPAPAQSEPDVVVAANAQVDEDDEADHHRRHQERDHDDD